MDEQEPEAPARSPQGRTRKKSLAQPIQGVTFEALLKKPARIKKVKVTLAGDDNESIEYWLTVQAIGAAEYDEMLSAHPPTRKQKEDGAVYNPDKFGPALIAASLRDPHLSLDQVTELWESNAWSAGERMDLFMACVRINSGGLDIPFTEKD